jgi:hypothetical protein
VTAAGQVVVKVRLRAHVYTSKVMSRAAAEKLRDELRDELRDAGDSPRLTTFTDRHGREVDLRCREVIVVELGVPERDDEPPRRGRHHYQDGGHVSGPGFVAPAAGARPLGVVQGGALAVPVPDGTGYLRHQAAVERSMADHPSGQRR